MSQAFYVTPPPTERINPDQHCNPDCIGHPERKSLSIEGRRPEEHVVDGVEQAAIQLAPSSPMQRE